MGSTVPCNPRHVLMALVCKKTGLTGSIMDVACGQPKTDVPVQIVLGLQVADLCLPDFSCRLATICNSFAALPVLGVACIPSAARSCCCCTDLVCLWLQALKYLEQLLLYDGKRRMKALDAANVSHWLRDQGMFAACAKVAVSPLMTSSLAGVQSAGCLGSLLALPIAVPSDVQHIWHATACPAQHALQCSKTCCAFGLYCQSALFGAACLPQP